MLVSGVLALIKIFAGMVGHSTAVIADRQESASDVFATGLVLCSRPRRPLTIINGPPVTTPNEYPSLSSMALGGKCLNSLFRCYYLALRRPSGASGPEDSDGAA
jgi:hypothetical protein